MKWRFTVFCGQKPVECVEMNEEILTESVRILHFKSIIKFWISITLYELKLSLPYIFYIFNFIFVQFLNNFYFISCIIIWKTEKESHKQIKQRIFVKRTNSSLLKQIVENLNVATMTTNDNINQILHFITNC